MEQVQKFTIGELQKRIFSLQYEKRFNKENDIEILPGPIRYAFPYKSFPVATAHEFCYSEVEDFAATTGFIAGIISSLMKNGGVSIWVNTSLPIYPPALKSFKILPQNILFIRLKKEKEILWVIDEALKCGTVTSVISEVKDISFLFSRRFQLSMENSGVTGFFLRYQPKVLSTACAARWKISSLVSGMDAGLPGISFPRWNVQLLKVKNGHTGKWQLEWKDGKFYTPFKMQAIVSDRLQKTG